MRLFWLMVVTSTRCSSSDEIPLDRAEQSSTHNDAADFEADKALDGDLITFSMTKYTQNIEEIVWLRLYFQSSSTVGKVVIQNGTTWDENCVYTVSVYDGEAGTVCGTYTHKAA